jgi:hypothetical protein
MEVLKIAFLLFLLSGSLPNYSQDKLYMRKGECRNGIVLSVAKDYVFFRTSDTSRIETLLKKDILIIEKENGDRYLFSSNQENSTQQSNPLAEQRVKRNIIGCQPFGILLGRITFVYERLSANGDFGLVLPVSLTFDPFGLIYKSNGDTSSNSPQHVPGMSYIIGCDLNYYLTSLSSKRFFLGPRFRYGTDQMLQGTEGYSLQFQLGWRHDSKKGVIQHLSLGYGFVRVLSVPASSTINPAQLYAWYSLNYRISLLR